MIALGVPSSARADDATHACVTAADDGQRLRDTGALTAARASFVACAAARCPALVRESCEAWLSELDARLPTVVLGARDAAGNDLSNARVTLDGREIPRGLDGHAIAVDPGPHDLVFTAPGHRPASQHLVVREGERLRPIVVALSAEPPARSRSVAPLVVSGVVAAIGLGGFAALGLIGQHDKRALEDTCAPSRTCARDDVSAARTKLLLADVSLLVGIGGAAAFAVLFATSSSRSVQLGVTPSRAGATGAVSITY